ncbi:MAG: helix-turn-helix domain-containing protein [Acutalibacteraceae bacterium]
MQACIKLNNSILDCGLTVNELKVAVFLYSCAYNNSNTVCVKQSVIAGKCGFKQVRTVSDIICRLQRKGIIEIVRRPYKRNGHLGTYIYTLKKIVSKGYFKVKRYILTKLNAVQLRMYLFICRAVTKKNDMWNSFNDISRALQIGRNKVIAVINELVKMGFIRKFKIIKKDGSYSDNHYSVTEPTLQAKKESPRQFCGLSGTFKIKIGKISYLDYMRSESACQGKSINLINFFSGVVP